MTQTAITFDYAAPSAEEFSQKIDGVKLFSIFSDISKDIDLRYTNGQIIASLPRSRESLEGTIQMIMRSKEAVRNAD